MEKKLIEQFIRRICTTIQ